MTKTTRTEPIIQNAYPDADDAAHLTLAATWKDPTTGALYVHQDLVQTQAPYAEEAHIGPMKVAEQFGDIESFVGYVTVYGDAERTFLTWNSRGLKAIVDYARDGLNPGRCQWTAAMPFRHSRPWETWMAFASNQPRSQKQAVENLEDLAADIVEPKPADLMGLLRSLRATVNAKADTELRPNGTSKVAFERDTKIATASAIELPASFTIAIPVLRGHLDSEDRPVVYRLDVRLRASVDDAGKLALRFAIPNAERILEDVYADRVKAAKALLGESFALLRASDG